MRSAGSRCSAFPCNQFGAQEPGDAAEIANFCSLTYDVTFPVFAKIDVNGAERRPAVRAAEGGGAGGAGVEGDQVELHQVPGRPRRGRSCDRYAPTTKPEDIRKDIEKLL